MVYGHDDLEKFADFTERTIVGLVNNRAIKPSYRESA